MQDLPVYSKRLTLRGVIRFDEIVPVLEMEGRKLPPKTKTRGTMAGEWDSETEKNMMLALTFEYKMVIDDWQKTPAYHALVRN